MGFMALSVNPNLHRETDAARLAQLSQDGECYDEMGKAITLALLSQPRWVTRTVESIRFVDRNVVRRRISRHFVVPKSGQCRPVLKFQGDDRPLDGERELCILPIYAVKKGHFITCDLTDGSGTSVSLDPLLDRWKLCYLSLLSVVRAAELDVDEILQKKLWDIVAHPKPAELGDLEAHLNGLGAPGRRFLDSSLFGLAQFYARNYVIFRTVPEASFEHVLTMRLDRRVPDRRQDFTESDQPEPSRALSVLRWLGVAPHEYRHEFVHSAGSTHLEVEAPDGIAIGERTLELPAAPAESSNDGMRARLSGRGTSKRRARFLVPRSSPAGACVGTMDLRAGSGVMRAGGPPVAALFTILAGIIAWRRPEISNGNQTDAATAILLLAPGFVSLIAARPAEHPGVSRVVVGMRMLTVSVVLLASLTGLALVVDAPTSYIVAAACCGFVLTAILTVAAVSARLGTRVEVEDRVAGITVPEPSGLEPLTRIG
ncbi:MAG: hypothetical protein QOF06_1242 [Solirubrobacterales bacterium]|jgi:hypothetical protein|nr:hypothetical protein [Solirubrobacterales bacterium]